MRNIKYSTLLAMLMLYLSVALAANEVINLHVGSQRFLDKDKNTIVHIDYQIPYNNLVFLAHKGGYFAEVDVTVNIIQGDSIVFEQSIRDNIGITNKEDSRSYKTYLNRISFLLDEEPYLFRLLATDLNSEKAAEKSFTAESLSREALISDLELCSIVRPDSSSYLNKFRRGNMLYQTQPSLIFDKNVSQNLSLYFEIYASDELRGKSGLLNLTVVKDSLMVFDRFIDFTPQEEIEGLTLRIPLSDLKPGEYEGNLEFQIEEETEDKDFVFFVTEPREEIFFLFTDPDDDYQLLRYFPLSSSTSDWSGYDEDTKRRYISQMWKSWALANNLDTAEMIEMMRERVDYANRYFSHFDKGWTTDMGRIHIRNGKPDEIEKGTSSDETRYVRKDYQIWKYRGRINAVYLFVDIQMNGNYRLIYVENDERESSNPDYLRYLGDDFDTSLLYN
jgi:GWxTD domain-containing protein